MSRSAIPRPTSTRTCAPERTSTPIRQSRWTSTRASCSGIGNSGRSDANDRDLSQVSPLFSATVKGKPRNLLTVSGKDGLLRMLDRDTHEVLYELPITTRTNFDAGAHRRRGARLSGPAGRDGVERPGLQSDDEDRSTSRPWIGAASSPSPTSRRSSPRTRTTTGAPSRPTRASNRAAGCRRSTPRRASRALERAMAHAAGRRHHGDRRRHALHGRPQQ